MTSLANIPSKSPNASPAPNSPADDSSTSAFISSIARLNTPQASASSNSDLSRAFLNVRLQQLKSNHSEYAETQDSSKIQLDLIMWGEQLEHLEAPGLPLTAVRNDIRNVESNLLNVVKLLNNPQCVFSDDQKEKLFEKLKTGFHKLAETTVKIDPAMEEQVNTITRSRIEALLSNGSGHPPKLIEFPTLTFYPKETAGQAPGQSSFVSEKIKKISLLVIAAFVAGLGIVAYRRYYTKA
jgi:hypothetical protein